MPLRPPKIEHRENGIFVDGRFVSWEFLDATPNVEVRRQLAQHDKKVELS
jgi:hypothetical protein